MTFQPASWRSGTPTGLRLRTGALLVLLALVAGGAPLVLAAAGASSGVIIGWGAVMAIGAAASFFTMAWRTRGRLRAAWSLMGTTATIATTLFLQLSTLVSPSQMSPFIRLVPLVLCTMALFVFPGTVSGFRNWVLLGLDGWLLGGSVFAFIWLAAVLPATLLDPPPGLAEGTAWVVGAIALSSTIFALTRRLPAGHRWGGLLLALAGALMATGDLVRAAVGEQAWTVQSATAYAVPWGLALAVAVTIPWVSSDPFGIGADLQAPITRPVRVPYLVACLAIASAVCAWALGRPPDPVLSAVVLTLLWSLLTSQVLLALENRTLMSQVRRQADMFRMRATQDGLTGLPNRSEFTGRVDSLLHSPGRGHVAVLFIDLDGFKDVNDSFGHAVGDELLIEAATRLAAEVRETDVVARFGGDEFVALLADCSDVEAVEVAERLRSSLSMPYKIGHRDVVVSASIGLAHPGDDDDAESALRNADLALYRAKESGRDRVSVYEPGMHADALRRLDAAGRLRHALAHDLLTLAYQPIVDLRTGSIYAMEALLRFDTGDFSDWTVTEVIEAAEESGLIVPVGGWVIDAAVGTLGRWRHAGMDVRMNINVSARQLEAGGDLALQVENALICHSVPPQALTIEITEHQLVRDLDHSTVELAKLRRLGVRVALDDFGTGYSSLSYLPRLPLDGLKIDRELTARVGSARDTVPAVLRLGRDLGLAVVAEGIERPEQLALLRTAGCTLGQGHLMSMPLGERAAFNLLASGGVLPLPGAVPERPATRTSVSDPETRRPRG
ncbi:MAG: EAL domain-containing protein [Actinobacteria bacterium]|nr:EAL domain-containing protein [Actinomycetota bacterium]